LFFFFQAEDGIRDRNVTGVQTCALPIYFLLDPRLEKRKRHFDGDFGERGHRSAHFLEASPARKIASHRAQEHALAQPSQRRMKRSEERRVGKECRSRGSPYEQKRKIEKE